MYTCVFKRFPSSRLPNQNLVCLSLLFHSLHILPSFRRPSFDRPNNVRREMQLRISFCSLLYPFYNPPLLRLKFLFQYSVLDNLSLYSPINMEGQVSHPYKTTGRIVISYISVVMLLDGI